jgi:hypothetical protein
VTAWHITDWLWQSSADARVILKKRYKVTCEETTTSGLRAGLERFQEAVAKESRTLEICRSIANGSKHMRTMKTDSSFKAAATWHPAVEAVGRVKFGDLVMHLTITDGGKELDAAEVFIEAAGYWEKLFIAEKLLSASGRLPDKVITAAPATEPNEATSTDPPKSQPYYHHYKG